MTEILLSTALGELNVSLEKSYASAFLAATTPTTTTLADTYYPIEGTFTNMLSNFTIVSEGIRYDGLETLRFKGLLFVSVASDTSTTTVSITITKNDVVQTGYESDRLLKLTSDIGAWGVPVDFTLETNDVLSLRTKSDKAGAELSFSTCISNVFPISHITE